MESVIQLVRDAAALTAVQVTVSVVVGAIALKSIVGAILSARTRSATAARHAKQAKDHVYLYIYSRRGGNIGQSPFGLRVEAFLRLHRIPYTAVYGMNFNVSPTQKLPCMELNGTAVCESFFMMEALGAHFHKATSYEDPIRQATYTAIRRICDDSLRLHSMRATLVDHPDILFAQMAEQTGIPKFIISFIVRRTYRKWLIEWLNGHGQGDLTDAQYLSEFMRDLKAIEVFLGKSKFLFSDDVPTVADTVLYPWLHNVVWSAKSVSSVPLQYAANSKVITEYVARVEAALFPDKSKLVTAEAAKLETQDFVF